MKLLIAVKWTEYENTELYGWIGLFDNIQAVITAVEKEKLLSDQRVVVYDITSGLPKDIANYTQTQGKGEWQVNENYSESP